MSEENPIIKALLEGKTYKEIQVMFGVSPNTISRLANEHKLLKKVKTRIISDAKGIGLETKIYKDQDINAKIEQWMTINFDIRKYLPNYFLQCFQLFLTLVKKQYPESKRTGPIEFAIQYATDFLNQNA